MKGKKLQLLLCLIVIGLDRIVKILFGNMDGDIWQGVIGFRSVHNTGIALGLFPNQVLGIIMFSILILAVGIFVYCRCRIEGLGSLGVVLLFGGAIGNLLDRILYGYVIDMFELLFMDFYIFNVADVAVVLGTGICAWSILFRPQEWRKR